MSSTPCSRASTPTAEYVVAWSDGGYTTNLPLDDMTGGQAWFAYEFDGEPLEPEHGGPARLVVPHLYFWKSAKWVRGLALDRARTSPGSGRPTATTTTATRGKSSGTGATDRAARAHRLAGRRRARETPPRRPSAHDRARRARLARARGRAARRRAPHRRGRLPGSALVLDRLGARGPAARAHGRAHRRRRGLALPGGRAASRATSRAAGPIGGYFTWRVERRRAAAPRRAAGRASCRCRPCSATARARASDVDARLLLSARALGDVLYRAELAGLADAGLLHT